MHYSLMGKMRLPFIDSELFYRGALSGRFDCKCKHFIFLPNFDGEEMGIYKLTEIKFLPTYAIDN